MTIEKAKELKTELEKSIFKLISDYEIATGVVVDSVAIEHSEYLNGDLILSEVKTDIVIGG